MCIHIPCPLKRMESLKVSYSYQDGRLVHPPRRKAGATEHSSEEKDYGFLLIILGQDCRFLDGNISRKRIKAELMISAMENSKNC